MEMNLLMSSSPHLRDKSSTQRLMLDVVIALTPAAIAGIYFFGMRVLLVLIVSVLSCVASEYLYRKLMKKEATIGDLSAVVTGILLAFNLPSTIPLWITAVGGFIAIIIIKQIFGGLGQNFMNPALAARVFMLVSWPVQMTKWVVPAPMWGATGSGSAFAAGAGADAISSATPLALIKKGKEVLEGTLPGYLDLFLGKVGGCIGEVSAAALLIGAIYLLARKVISFEIPLGFIGTLAVFIWIFGGDSPFTGDFVYHILAGSLILGAFFMATDYSTSPITSKGRLIMGIGCGLLTGVIRLYANYPEGVSFAIILMNIVTPLIDRYTVPKTFGTLKAIRKG